MFFSFLNSSYTILHQLSSIIFSLVLEAWCLLLEACRFY